MASYSIVPTQSVLKMTLYAKEVYGNNPDTNGTTIIEKQGPMGTTWVFSWLVTDGRGPNANVVGRLQGTGVQVAYGVYHYSLGLVFQGNSWFNRSTLQISGTSEINGEWSIVGGTGKLTMAKGTIKRTQIKYENYLSSELIIHACYAPMDCTNVSGTERNFLPRTE